MENEAFIDTTINEASNFILRKGGGLLYSAAFSALCEQNSSIYDRIYHSRTKVPSERLKINLSNYIITERLLCDLDTAAFEFEQCINNMRRLILCIVQLRQQIVELEKWKANAQKFDAI